MTDNPLTLADMMGRVAAKLAAASRQLKAQRVTADQLREISWLLISLGEAVKLYAEKLGKQPPLSGGRHTRQELPARPEDEPPPAA